MSVLRLQWLLGERSLFLILDIENARQHPLKWIKALQEQTLTQTDIQTRGKITPICNHLALSLNSVCSLSSQWNQHPLQKLEIKLRPSLQWKTRKKLQALKVQFQELSEISMRSTMDIHHPKDPTMNPSKQQGSGSLTCLREMTWPVLWKLKYF